MRLIEKLVLAMFVVFMIEIFFPEILNILSFSLKKAIFQPWRFFTNAFLHANPTHLIFNSIVIISIGTFIEDEIGKRNMLLLFLSSVLASNLVFGLLHPDSEAIGSSGFAFAIEGIATVLNPNLPVIVWGIPTTMGVAGLTFFFLELVLAILFPNSQIAHIAHVAGFVVGAIFGYYLRKKSRIVFQYYL